MEKGNGPIGKSRVVEVMKRVTVEWKACTQCGKKFEGLKKARYCSKACANKADYQRHAEQRRRQRTEKYHAEKKAAAGKK